MYSTSFSNNNVHMYGTVSTNSSNLMPSALGLINPVETFTLEYNLYLYITIEFEMHYNESNGYN